MFTGTSALDFAKIFPDNESCYKLLDEIKWKNGYRCFKCGAENFIKGRTHFHRRCCSCDYDESLTANTLFHDMRMPIRKALYMIFRIAVKIKGMSTAELAREVGVQQRTAWLLKRKVQLAMQRSEHQLSFLELIVATLNKLLIDEANKANHSSELPGRNGKDRSPFAYKKTLVKTTNKTVGYAYRIVVSFVNFLGTNHLQWSYPGNSVQRLLFKSWLGGVHHKCSEALFKNYCDEFAYRYDRRQEREHIFEMLVTDMLHTKPSPYKVLRLGRG